MKNFIVNSIRNIAVFMFVMGVIMLFVCVMKGNDAGYYSRDTAEKTMWYFGIFPSVLSILNSFIVYGFSYVVDAACKYIEKREQETENENMESE